MNACLPLRSLEVGPLLIEAARVRRGVQQVPPTQPLNRYAVAFELAADHWPQRLDLRDRHVGAEYLPQSVPRVRESRERLRAHPGHREVEIAAAAGVATSHRSEEDRLEEAFGGEETQHLTPSVQQDDSHVQRGRGR